MTTVAVWYDAGLRFQCQEGCTACCGGFPGDVWVDAGERKAIAEHLVMSVDAFNEKYARRTGRGHSLKEVDNYDCVFLNESGCGIYAARPRQCRTFPFWEENLSGPSAWKKLKKECPGIGVGRLWSREEIDRIKH